MLLLTFPNFQQNPALIADRLRASNASPEILTLWQTLSAQTIQMPNEDDEF